MNRLLLAFGVVVVAGCGDARPRVGNPSDPAGRVGTPTGTTQSECAAAGLSGLTYANFGQAFATAWCVRCHSTSKVGIDRQGAPADHNFDTYAGIKLFEDHIDQVAAMNPTGSQKNTFMPISEPVPPDDERKKLACWIATGLAQ